MQIRITKTRAAIAALFVLAGVGLGSLLSPLVGTALATAGQIVNISDRSGSAYFAKVGSDRETGGRRRLRRAERGRNGRGSPGCACLALAREPGHPGARGGDRWSEPGADQRHQPLRSRPIASSGSNVQVILPALGGKQRHDLQRGKRPSLWQIRDAGRRRRAPLSFTFPTPLQWKPPANTKACLFALAATSVGDDDERCRLLRRLTSGESRRTFGGVAACSS